MFYLCHARFRSDVLSRLSKKAFAPTCMKLTSSVVKPVCYAHCATLAFFVSLLSTMQNSPLQLKSWPGAPCILYYMALPRLNLLWYSRVFVNIVSDTLRQSIDLPTHCLPLPYILSLAMEIADTLKVHFVCIFLIDLCLHCFCLDSTTCLPAVFALVWSRSSRCEARKPHV